jgi:hypothetical protein
MIRRLILGIVVAALLLPWATTGCSGSKSDSAVNPLVKDKSGPELKPLPPPGSPAGAGQPKKPGAGTE